ncbi:universal stress protein [Salinigranum sp. GCM10025319]|uniref:universal stress protein n=1 Tax=Salinigranum sp. GCM10025319 TaxID=3252687 RepID=UPI003606B22E
MYDTVLFPTNGSDGAEVALAHALELARQYDAEIHVLFVVNTAYAGSGAVEATTVESLRGAGDRVVAETVERITDDGVAAVGEVRDGDPYREILDYADESDCDVIVMGTHGRRGLDRYLLGSVTEKVVRASDVPVLTVRLSDDEG